MHRAVLLVHLDPGRNVELSDQLGQPRPHPGAFDSLGGGLISVDGQHQLVAVVGLKHHQRQDGGEQATPRWPAVEGILDASSRPSHRRFRWHWAVVRFAASHAGQVRAPARCATGSALRRCLWVRDSYRVTATRASACDGRSARYRVSGRRPRGRSAGSAPRCTPEAPPGARVRAMLPRSRRWPRARPAAPRRRPTSASAEAG